MRTGLVSHTLHTKMYVQGVSVYVALVQINVHCCVDCTLTHKNLRNDFTRYCCPSYNFDKEK